MEEKLIRIYDISAELILADKMKNVFRVVRNKFLQFHDDIV